MEILTSIFPQNFSILEYTVRSCKKNLVTQVIKNLTIRTDCTFDSVIGVFLELSPLFICNFSTNGEKITVSFKYKSSWTPSLNKFLLLANSIAQAQ